MQPVWKVTKFFLKNKYGSIGYIWFSPHVFNESNLFLALNTSNVFFFYVISIWHFSKNSVIRSFKRIINNMFKKCRAVKIMQFKIAYDYNMLSIILSIFTWNTWHWISIMSIRYFLLNIWWSWILIVPKVFGQSTNEHPFECMTHISCFKENAFSNFKKGNRYFYFEWNNIFDWIQKFLCFSYAYQMNIVHFNHWFDNNFKEIM